MIDVPLTLIAKPGCHLCDEARIVLDDVLNSTEIQQAGIRATVTELNILDDEELQHRYGEEIPVLLIDGRQHSYWRIDASRLTRTLLERQ